MEKDISRENLFGKSLSELETFFVSVGEKKFRAKQVFQWLYKRGADSFDEMSDLSKGLRDTLHSTAKIEKLKLLKTQKSGESTATATQKLLFELSDGQKIESVIIPDEDRRTLCISSQVGCAVACQFCATGWMGFRRNLTVGEILDQLIHVQKHLGETITNIVYMGMGEPFLNYENVISSAEIITSELGLGFGAKRITISTSGIIPKIIEFTDSKLQYNLAVSMNATTDEVRQNIMPITKKYPLADLLDAIKYYNSTRRMPATLEYVLLSGVNDSEEDAYRLKKMADRFGQCKINVIPYNPIEGPNLKRPSPEKILSFMRSVSFVHAPLTLRRSRGDDISAACGQLATEKPNKNYKKNN